jgi:hypothetical protein
MNGNLALRLVTPDIPLPPATAAEPIEHKIAEAAADAVAMIGQGILDFAGIGILAPETRATAGGLFVKLFELQEATRGQLNFAVVARTQGKSLLRQRHAAHPETKGRELDEIALDELFDGVLSILARVTADALARPN